MAISLVALLGGVFTSWSGLRAGAANKEKSPNCKSAAAPHVNLSGCNLEGRKLIKGDLAGANFSNANLHGISIGFEPVANADTNLAGANFTHANLSHSEIGGNLSGADFEGADLVSASLLAKNLSKLNFSHADLAKADIEGFTDIGTNFSRSNLSYAQFINDNLTSADFQNAYLVHAVIQGTKLIGTNFAGADLAFATFGPFGISSPEDPATIQDVITTSSTICINNRLGPCSDTDLDGAGAPQRPPGLSKSQDAKEVKSCATKLKAWASYLLSIPESAVASTIARGLGNYADTTTASGAEAEWVRLSWASQFTGKLYGQPSAKVACQGFLDDGYATSSIPSAPS